MASNAFDIRATAPPIGSRRKTLSANLMQVDQLVISFVLHSCSSQCSVCCLSHVLSAAGLRQNLLETLQSVEKMQGIVDMDDHMEQNDSAWPVIL